MSDDKATYSQPDAVGNRTLLNPGSSGGSGGSSADRATAARAQDARGLASKVKASPFVPPRMEPNEDSAAYAARVARAREAYNQKKAMQ